MSTLYQYFANETYQPLKSPVSGAAKSYEDDDMTPTTGNIKSKKHQQQRVIVEIPVGSSPDFWVGSELQVTRTDSTLSHEEITLDGSSRRSSRGSGSDLGVDDLSSVEIGEVSSNEDLETSSSGSSSFGVKYNNYTSKKLSPRKTDEPDMAEVKDLGFYTLGISRRPGDQTHRPYVQLSTPNSERGESVLPFADVTEASSEPDLHNEGIWREGSGGQPEKNVKEPDTKFTNKRKVVCILGVVVALVIVAVAVGVGVTRAGKSDTGKNLSATSLSAPSSSTNRPIITPRAPLTSNPKHTSSPTLIPPTILPSKTTAISPPPSLSPTPAPSVTSTAPPSLTLTAPPTPLLTAPPSGTNMTQSPSRPTAPLTTEAPSTSSTQSFSAPPTQTPTALPSLPVNTAPNDNCSRAFGPLKPNSAIEFGTTVGSSLVTVSSCGNSISEPGVWYTVIGTGETFNASTCNEATNFQARLSIYTGVCGNLGCVDENYNGYQSGTCQDGASTISWQSQPKALYFIFVYGAAGATGNFVLDIRSTPSSSFASCNSTSTMLPTDGSVTLVTTMGASLVNASTCGTTKAGYGAWFYVNGTGRVITADTCNSGSTLDTALSIFTGSCDALFCTAGNDNYCGLQSSVSWTSIAGQIYHVLVLTISETGSFGLTVQSA